VALPIRQGGEIRGTMRLSYEVADVRAQFNQLRGLLFGGIGVTLLLAVVVGLGLATTITRPLRRLTHHAQEVAAGKYDVRVSLHRQDEVGVLADALNRMAAKLEESQAARRRQLAAIVHELSRPLAGLHAAVETLLDEDGVDPEVSRRLLSGIADELSRLERLTDSLHNLDRRRLQPLQLQRSRVDLGRIVRAGVAMFEPRAMQMEIALSAALPVDLPELEADEDRLIQVLTNLLDNAIKFTPRNGTIQVTVMEQADAVSVTVANSGEGISPTELPQLFQQFYRGDESRPPEKRGMGLGLTLCQEIINAHGGRIWVESRQGDGAQVSFTLPTLSPRICSVAAQPQPDRRLAPTQG
jgi:two-component system sensor histidine kinase BaeS